MRKFALTLNLIVIITASAVLVGWYLKIQTLKSLLPYFNCMNPLTAVNFIVIGLASIFCFDYHQRSPLVQRILLLIFFLIALSSLPRIFESMSLQSQVALDLILFKEELYKYAQPPRIAPNTVVCFLFIAISFITYFKKKSLLSEILLLPVFALSGLSIIGYLYSQRNLMGFGPFYPMAFHTACLFIMSSFSLLIIQPPSRFMLIFAAKTAGAKMAKRFLPVVIVVPIVLSYLRLQGQRAGYFELEFGVSLITISTIIVFFIFLWIYAKDVNQHERHYIESQRDVKRKSQLLDAILTNIPLTIFHIDEDGIYLESRGKGLEVLGLKDNELTGKNIHKVFSDRAEVVQKILKADNKPIISTNNRNGQDYSFETYAFPDNISHNGVIGISLDITKKKQVERELFEAKEKAEMANVIKSRFLANMSHEIRTPINAIMGFAEMLHKHEANIENKEQLKNILISGDILLKLIGDVLDMNKIEEGKLTFDETIFNLNDTITASLVPYKSSALKKGLAFNIIIDENIPSNLKGDIHKIRQVIINLVGNALKFTNEGSLEVICELLNVSDTNQCALIKVSVSDTGIGVSKESQHMIFESFTQADSSISKQYGGSGLGLSIVKQIVKFLNSEIHVVSPINENGNGTMFWFELKLDISQESARQTVDDKDQDINFNGCRILIVDDNELNRKLAGVMLKKQNCILHYAANGLQAIAKVEAEAFDLILMDIQMPEMDGVEATGIIRSKNMTMPIIALTANVYMDDIKHYEYEGFSGYLSKPYTQKKLISAIHKLIMPSHHTIPS